METVYQPYYVDPQLELLIERIYPPRVCIDNDTFQDCTLVKVDSANKHGILLEMVQVLTDLDLVISKSYISSDGGWFMDVFHVTDQFGNKVTDESLIHYIKQALCASRREGSSRIIRTCNMGKELLSSEHTAAEITGIDRPGLLSEIFAVLVELGCNVTAAVAWTHHKRAASIVYIEEGWNGGVIKDPKRLAHVQEQLENVVDAHNGQGETSSVKLTAPSTGRTHTERRLHQLMYANGDYEQCRCRDHSEICKKNCTPTHVGIESCKEKGYSIINIKSRDRPKLLFDTVCALTDLQYVVFHAAVSSNGTVADQEYFIRHKGGCILDSESERKRLLQALIAAIERRVSHGLRLELDALNRMGLLSDITRVFRENGFSISTINVGTNGERAFGSIFVTDASGYEVDVDPQVLELVLKEIGGSIAVVQGPSNRDDRASSSRANQGTKVTRVEDKPRFSLGNLLWSQLERLSSNFGSV
ncbi:ACT domain-containing protein ACR1 [Benincasa hispida]|uniref:ACT domain-containing protein ACR1 n=1 Tax=Benincasa hispida TaxID=102211 RepID=UPI001901CE1C|nr:ACT domain-containing protein ACR1 [Benincasa hispida]